LPEDDVSEFERPFWVRSPWKVLFDLVKLHKVQPWNVDLSHILTTLIKEMGGKGYVDFSASGIALLSSAVIYRKKSEQILELQEPPKPPPEKVVEVLPPPIQLPYRFEYTSTTVKNLVNALEEILQEESYIESAPKPAPILPEPMILRELDDFMIDIENKIEDIYRTLLILAEKNPVIQFSQLVQRMIKHEVIRTFLVLLFLASRGRIQLWQDEEFGEIYISLSKETASTNGATSSG
jgi:segregation and condensation protein A